MRLPIQYAFAYPDRWDGMLAPLDVAALRTLEFEPPDEGRFPCLRLAYAALERGGAWPIVLNAANEVAVEAFLAGRIAFPAIPMTIEKALAAADRATSLPRSLADVRAADTWAREFSIETLSTLRSS
jgi:1-deoxy-D-xylulose-5-phosphate reductoisomerase